MFFVKILSIILVAAYLIFDGIIAVTGGHARPLVNSGIGLIAVAAGVLILISLSSHTNRKS